MNPWRKCRGCGHWYPPHLVSAAFPYKDQARCVGCLRARDRSNEQNIFPRKASSTRGLHANRLGLSLEDMCENYGWHLEVVTDSAREAYAKPCPLCGQSYFQLGDMTLDVIHADQPPYWDANTRWICGRCNRWKFQLGEVEFARRCQAIDIYLGKVSVVLPAEVIDAEQATLFEMP